MRVTRERKLSVTSFVGRIGEVAAGEGDVYINAVHSRASVQGFPLFII